MTAKTIIITWAAILALTLGTSASAQSLGAGKPAPSVAHVQFDVDDWTFVPTMSGSRVDSILALRDQSAIVGSNVSAVWLRRGKSSWIAMAWSDPDQSKAIGYVKQELGISDKYDGLWPVTPQTEGTTAPAVFKSGVFIDDPLRPVIEASPDPKSTVDNLVAGGIAAASIQLELLDLTDGCDKRMVFEAIAEGIALQMQGGDGEELAHAGLQTLGCISFCIRWTWTTAGPTLTGCSCNWSPTTGCAWNTLHCAMVCDFTGTSTCTYTRTRMRRTWSCATCTWIETGTKMGTVTCTSTEYFVEQGCVNPGPGYVPPTAPDCSCPEPSGGITWTGTPPC